LKRYFDVKEKLRRRAQKKQQTTKPQRRGRVLFAHPSEPGRRIDLDELYRWMADDMMDAVIRAMQKAQPPKPARV